MRLSSCSPAECGGNSRRSSDAPSTFPPYQQGGDLQAAAAAAVTDGSGLSVVLYASTPYSEANSALFFYATTCIRQLTSYLAEFSLITQSIVNK